MKLIILQHKALLSVECKNLALLRLHRMINEGVLLLDAQYNEPIVIDFESSNGEKPRNGKTVNFCFVDESAAIEQLNEEKEALIKEKKDRQERTIKKVEKALGFTLFDWQKDYIFNNKDYGAEISFARRAGKTLAHILRVCLSDGEPLQAKLSPACLAKNEFLRYLGEDGVTFHRSQWFVSELKKVYTTLKDAGGIDLREIEF